MLKILRNQKGQASLTEIIIIMSIIIGIAALVVASLEKIVVKTDSTYQSEVKDFFMQGD